MRAGANLPAVGGYNQTVILDVIRRAPEGISRVEVAARTGLSAQTASNVCRRLLDEGLIVEAGTHVVGVGKPRTILKLNPRSRFAIGVHLDPSVITVVLLDLAGGIVVHRTIQTSDTDRPTGTIDQIAQVADEVTREAGIDRARVMGVGIAAPGPVDMETGTVLDPPLLAGWKNVPIRDALAERVGLPVLLEKDVTAAAVAELWMRSDDEPRNLVFFYLGTGVGAGLVVQNEVIRGVSNNAGDIGSMIVGDAALVPGSRRWRLGDAVMPRLLVHEALERGAIERGSIFVAGTEPSRSQVRALFRRLADAAGAADPAALDILGAVADDIAMALVILSNLLDIDEVVFGGPFWEPVADFLLQHIPARVRSIPELVPAHPIAFITSTIGEDVAAVGAACLVLDHTFSPRSEGLLIRRVGE
ncbi:MAG: ROK family transcriptional regulator [Microbacteriaceae bacterium]|nr:MAG: ROK family transcriptional regulator [Microbacteriaceae bacterium]